MNRREFLSTAALLPATALGEHPPAVAYRIAFELWVNDVRNEGMPLEPWPYGVIDDKTIDGIVRALDVQAAAGYNAVDFCGLFATNAWPVDLHRAVDRERQRRISAILKACHQRGLKVICFPAGVMTWGFEEILKHDPRIRSDNPRSMNPLVQESWDWQFKVFDYVIENYDIDGIHLEAADQGRCNSRECLEKWPDNASYYAYVTGRTADYLRQKHPRLELMATIQGFAKWGTSFSDEQQAALIELSKRVDCIFDQGHGQTYIPQTAWRDFIGRLHCGYGTSGGVWVYPPQRWPRLNWFLPYTVRAGRHLRQLAADGGRGVMFYQGPVINPGVEVNIAFGGRMMSDPGKEPREVLAKTLQLLYRPRNEASHQALVHIFEEAENIYFGQWNNEALLKRKVPIPGELYLTSMPGSTPGPAIYLIEPFLDTAGRLAYKQGLISLFKDLQKIQVDFEDRGRIARIQKCIANVLLSIDDIARAKGEKTVWHEWTYDADAN